MSASPGVVRVQQDWDDKKAGESFWASKEDLGSGGVVEGTVTLSASSDGSKIATSETFSDARLVGASSRLLEVAGQRFLAPLCTLTEGVPKPALGVAVFGGLGAVCGPDGELRTFEVYSRDELVAPVWRHALVGHCGDVNFAKFFPSGKVLLSGGLDTTLRIWDVASDACNAGRDAKRQAATLAGHTRAVSGADMIGRGRQLVSCSWDGTSRMWDCSTQQTVSVLPCASEKYLNAVCLVGERSVVLAGDDTTLRCCDLIAGTIEWNVKGTSAFTSCASPRPGLVVSGDADGVLKSWDMRKTDAPLSSAGSGKSAGPVTSLVPAVGCVGVWAAGGSGLSWLWECSPETPPRRALDLTGPGFELLHSISNNPSSPSQTVTSSRDGTLRFYTVPASPTFMN